MQDNDDDARDRENRAVLIAAGVLVAIGVVAMLLFSNWQNQSDCVLAGHHNCAPINTGQ